VRHSAAFAYLSFSQDSWIELVEVEVEVGS
jgi:hypothetical protein